MPPPPTPTARIFAADRVVVGDGAERDGPRDARVDVLDAEPIARAEQRRAARGGLVGELELGVPADRRAHRARVVDADHLGERRAALLLFEIERDRRDLLDGRARVAAGAHRAIAAHQHEAAAEIAHVARERVDLRRREIARADVAEDDEVVAGEPAEVGGDARSRRARSARKPLASSALAMNAPLPASPSSTSASAGPRTRTNVLPALSSGESSLARIERGDLDVVAVQARPGRLLAEAEHVLARADLAVAACG